MTQVPDRYPKARRITLIAGAANLLLSALKILVGLSARSHALVADGIHSLSDIFIDFLVLLTTRVGSREADHNHPYGHGRIETIGTVLLAMLIITVGLAIGYDALDSALNTEHAVAPGILALWVALASIAIKEGLYRATLRVAKNIQSMMLKASAWHHRSDAAASLIVVVGLLGSYIGFPWLDAVAAIALGLKIAYMGGRMAWSGILELVDSGVEPDKQAKLEHIIAGVPGVVALHQLRTRKMSGRILLDVHIIVAPRLSVSEGHQIGESVRAALHRDMSSVQDVTVHIDPEDDEICAPCAHLPLRDAILPLLMQAWQSLPGAADILSVQLHYLSGEIDAHVCLPMRYAEAELTTQYQQAVVGLNNIHTVTLFFTFGPSDSTEETHRHVR